MLVEDLEEVHVTCAGGARFLVQDEGFFTLKNSNIGDLKIPFEGVAFGGNFGGHNVNVNLPEDDRETSPSKKKILQKQRSRISFQKCREGSSITK